MLQMFCEKVHIVLDRSQNFRIISHMPVGDSESASSFKFVAVG